MYRTRLNHKNMSYAENSIQNRVHSLHGCYNGILNCGQKKSFWPFFSLQKCSEDKSEETICNAQEHQCLASVITIHTSTNTISGWRLGTRGAMENKMTKYWSVSIEEEMKRNPTLKQQSIDEIREWIVTQKHLPNIADNNIVMFLHACHYNVERAKLTIDVHYSYRTLMKEIFTSRDPDGNDVKLIKECCSTAILPGTDKDGNYVLWGHMHNSDLKKFKFASAGKLYIMTADVLQLEKGTVPGVVTVYDVKNMGLSHLLSTPVSTIRHYVVYCQDASPFPVKAIHFVNTHPVMDKLMSLVKPFIKSNVWKIQFFHSNIESLYKHIPKDIIPQEYGGNAGPLQDICEKSFEKLKEHREFFIEEESLRVDELLRADKTQTAALSEMIKKLNID